MNYDISYSIAAIIIGVILVTILFLNYSSTNLLNRRFKIFLIATIVMYSMNVLTVFTNEHANEFPIWISYLLNGIYFSASNATAGLFLYYVLSLVYFEDQSNRFYKTMFVVNMSLFAVDVVLLIINGFTGIFFKFVDGVYTRGPIYLYVNVVSILYVVESIILFIVRRYALDCSTPSSLVLMLPKSISYQISCCLTLLSLSVA